MKDELAAYEPLRPLMRDFGAGGMSPKRFYWAVNQTYHELESEVYDQIHCGMFLGLRPTWKRLIESLPKDQPKFRVLDVGCGTGLVGQFLNLECSDRIGQIVLLDPCQAMLDKAAEKAQTWPFESQFVMGDIFSINAADYQFDVVTVNSTLHHIVDLDAFLSNVTRLVVPGGILLQAHDERAEASYDAVYAERHSGALMHRRVTFLPRLKRKLLRVFQTVSGVQTEDPVLELEHVVNKRLMETGIITSPMDIGSIWAVTDFHVSGQPGNFGHGISLHQLRSYLKPFDLVVSFTYDFFGMSWEQLTEEERELEKAYLNANNPHGRLFASGWRKSSKHWAP